MLTFVPTSGGTHQSGHSSTAEKPSAISHPNKKTKYRDKIVIIYMLHKNKKIKNKKVVLSFLLLFYFSLNEQETLRGKRFFNIKSVIW